MMSRSVNGLQQSFSVLYYTSLHLPSLSFTPATTKLLVKSSCLFPTSQFVYPNKNISRVTKIFKDIHKTPPKTSLSTLQFVIISTCVTAILFHLSTSLQLVLQLPCFVLADSYQKCFVLIVLLTWLFKFIPSAYLSVLHLSLFFFFNPTLYVPILLHSTYPFSYTPRTHPLYPVFYHCSQPLSHFLINITVSPLRSSLCWFWNSSF